MTASTWRAEREPRDGVPLTLRASAGWTWRILVLALGVVALLKLMSRFQVLVVPVLLALLVVALLKPAVDGLTARPGRAGLPRSAAALVGILLTLILIGALIGLIGQQVSTGFPDLRRQSLEGVDQLRTQLRDGPLHLTGSQIADATDQVQTAVGANRDRLVTGAMQVGSTAADIATGFFLVLLSTFFFLSGGDRIWGWLVGLFPRDARPRVNGAGLRAWASLTAYVRATVIVAVVDGVGVGAVAAILRVPLAVPLGVLVFLGAFVPVVGALVTGIVAVLVALVAAGPVVAGLMLLGVIAVQQIEAHVLQPFLMGHAVRVHPLAVILAIGAGVLLAGIVGGLFAVPLVAVINVVVRYLNEPDPWVPASGAGSGAAAAVPGAVQDADDVVDVRAGSEVAARAQAEDAAEEAGPLADESTDASRAARGR
ncbi:MAG: AI-2E family transporter [Kineosporiaceae bacterium]